VNIAVFSLCFIFIFCLLADCGNRTVQARRTQYERSDAYYIMENGGT
jgi:hypothetical protein